MPSSRRKTAILKNHDYFDTSEDEEDGDEEYHDIKGKVCGVLGWIQPDLVGGGGGGAVWGGGDEKGAHEDSPYIQLTSFEHAELQILSYIYGTHYSSTIRQLY